MHHWPHQDLYTKHDPNPSMHISTFTRPWHYVLWSYTVPEFLLSRGVGFILRLSRSYWDRFHKATTTVRINPHLNQSRPQNRPVVDFYSSASSHSGAFYGNFKARLNVVIRSVWSVDADGHMWSIPRGVPPFLVRPYEAVYCVYCQRQGHYLYVPLCPLSNMPRGQRY